MYEYIKILLVEDEAPLLGAMSLKLSKAGFTVLQAHNGREGLDIAMKEFPNIIITDIVMPEMDGLQMIQNIRQDQQWGASAPIILLTNLNDFNHVATAMEYGVHDYLVKSNWKLKDLLETVKSKLNLTSEGGTPAPQQATTTTDTQNIQQPSTQQGQPMPDAAPVQSNPIPTPITPPPSANPDTNQTPNMNGTPPLNGNPANPTEDANKKLDNYYS